MSTDTFGDPDLLPTLLRASQPFPGEIGLHAKNLATGAEVGIRADEVMPTASVIKVGIMAELYRQAEVGTVELARRIRVTKEDWFGGTGVLKEFLPGVEPTVTDLCRLMIIVSDNVATGILVRLLGKDAVNSSFQNWSLPHTELRWNMALGGDIRQYAVSTPRELSRLMELIATDGILTPKSCAAMRDHLGRQQHLEQIPRGLPFDQYGGETGRGRGIEVRNKIGCYMGVRADAAIIESGDVTFVMAAMNEGSPDHGFSVDQEGNVLNGRLGRVLFDSWIGSN